MKLVSTWSFDSKIKEKLMEKISHQIRMKSTPKVRTLPYQTQDAWVRTFILLSTTTWGCNRPFPLFAVVGVLPMPFNVILLENFLGCPLDHPGSLALQNSGQFRSSRRNRRRRSGGKATNTYVESHNCVLSVLCGTAKDDAMRKHRMQH
jgi:hypothetical protein